MVHHAAIRFLTYAGLSRIDFGLDDTARTVAVDGQGRIVVGGEKLTDGNYGNYHYDLAVARLHGEPAMGVERHYVVQDANFNVTSIIREDGAGGWQVTERYLYDPYGERSVLDADWTADADGLSDVAFVYGHQGGRHDLDVGLVHFCYRDLDTSLGRWTRQDPAGYVDGANSYGAYASSPALLTDPYGLTVVVTGIGNESGAENPWWTLQFDVNGLLDGQNVVTVVTVVGYTQSCDECDDSSPNPFGYSFAIGGGLNGGDDPDLEVAISTGSGQVPYPPSNPGKQRPGESPEDAAAREAAHEKRKKQANAERAAFGTKGCMIVVVEQFLRGASRPVYTGRVHPADREDFDFNGPGRAGNRGQPVGPNRARTLDAYNGSWFSPDDVRANGLQLSRSGNKVCWENCDGSPAIV